MKDISLIKGRFNKSTAENLITQLFQVKIRHHERRIAELENEEDIKQCEKRIIELQKDLYQITNYLKRHDEDIDLDCTLQVKSTNSVLV